MAADPPEDWEIAARAALPTREQLDEPRFQLQTAVMVSLPHAATIGKMFNWRYAADEFVRLLRDSGYDVVKVD
jgi:hypothetical protein